MGHYLVTGAAGFIASKVVELLLEEGHTVVGVDNLNDAYDVRLKEWRLDHLEGRVGLEFHRLDVRDVGALREMWRGHEAKPFDGVVNLAARAGVRYSVENPSVYFQTNLMGTLNLLEMCRDHGVQKFVLASTSSLYGAENPLPFKEDAGTSRPLSPYAASKGAAELLCHSYHYLHGIDVTVLRYFTVYGPAGRPDMSLFRFVQWIREQRPLRIYGDGKQSRDFTYVDDIARGTVAALRPVGYEVINLGSDKPVILLDAIRLVEGLLGMEAQVQSSPRHPADMPATWADIGKAARVLGWRPEVGFEAGLEMLVQWYVENRDWAKDVETG